MSNPWLHCPGLPAGAAAALAALHFADPQPAALARLTDGERAAGLDFCHHAGLALLAREVSPEATARDAAHNLLRLRTLDDTYRQLAALPVEFLALKGITQCELFGIRPEDRAQSDIDLYCPRDTVMTAAEVLYDLGYQPIPGLEAFPTDHLPAMWRPTGWLWRGDFFDPEMPLAIELHFQFWNSALERLPAEGLDEFWTRRVRRTVGGTELAVLSPPDAVAYAALHLLKHVLHGDTKAFHVYEIASFLHGHAADGAFWKQWRGWHSESARRLQTVSFLLAEAWFGCGMPAAVREEAERLPAATRLWFEQFAVSPATQRFAPNKDELWLHLSLLASASDGWSVARRRLIPSNLPPTARASSTQSQSRVYAEWFLRRLRHHTISLGTTLTSGARWWWLTNPYGAQFWIFAAVAVCFNAALFLFFPLYDRYLEELGLTAGAAGEISAASRIGTLAGTLPAAWVVHRFTLRGAVVGAIAATVAITLARALVTQSGAASGLAFAGGAAFAIWGVAMAPAIAGAVGEAKRVQAFSFVFAMLFAAGIAGNWAAGPLAALLGGTRAALLVPAALAGLALWPALRLKGPASPSGGRIFPRGAFPLRFLAPLALWQLATGAFNPFAGIYFAERKFGIAEAGAVLSAGQLVQVIGALCTPMVIRRYGLVSGIGWMMAATALSLGGLAGPFPADAVVLGYAFYVAFQWMCEPALHALLMNRTSEGERAGAASYYYLIAFGAQSAAAYGAGMLLEGSGFGVVLGGAAVVALLAALLFRVLLKGSD